MPYRFLSRSLMYLGGAVCLWMVAGNVTRAGAQSPTPGRLGLNDLATPTPQPLDSAAPTPAGADYVPPKVLKRGPVAYPILANLNRIEGVVTVRFSIDEYGKVKDAIAYRASGSVTLDSVVKSRGIMEWTFQPATLAGKPIPSTIIQEIEFRLDPVEQRQLALKRLAAPVGTPDPPYPAEALAATPRPQGECTIGVFWTPAGLVDIINLLKSSGSSTLDHAALRFVYENWRIDPPAVKAKPDKEVQFTKVISFVPPPETSVKLTPTNDNGTPPPLGTGTPAPRPTATPKKRAN